MRIINKKYLLIILLVVIISTGVMVGKPKENIQLDNVVLKQEIDNKTFAMYKETDDGYEEYKENNFPKEYVLNLNKSKCIDNNGKEVENVLSYENNEVTITSGKTTYCYLYFDKSLGLEIKDENPNGLKIDKVRGEMYRFQGQQDEGINNYICFGTSDKDECVKDTDHYMYRIIGIEASSGRVKVIKKEVLEQEYQWWDNIDEDIEFPKSIIHEAINGSDFLKNTDYVPVGWEEKIANNTWLYGDMSNGIVGARQIGEGVYLVETGQKGTIWYEKANEGDARAQKAVVENSNSPNYEKTFYYIRHDNETWTKTFDSKVSLMYIHDYHYSISDTANCQLDENNYEICKTGWMHLSNNDHDANNEWTMSRYGWSSWDGFYVGRYVDNAGDSFSRRLSGELSARPVFYINASEKLLSGIGSESETLGTLDNPFIIN